MRRRLGLPKVFRLHDSRASKINNDLDAGENPVEVAANARHHNPGYTMRAYGRRRAEAAKKLAGASAARIGLDTVARSNKIISVGHAVGHEGPLRALTEREAADQDKRDRMSGGGPQPRPHGSGR